MILLNFNPNYELGLCSEGRKSMTKCNFERFGVMAMFSMFLQQFQADIDLPMYKLGLIKKSNLFIKDLKINSFFYFCFKYGITVISKG